MPRRSPIEDKIVIARRDAVAFLQKEKTAVIATVFEGQPRASTVYYVIDDELNLYFATKRNSGKTFNTAFNNKVAVVVGTGPEHISVQMTGTADLVLGVEKDRVMRLLEKDQEMLGHIKTPIKSLSEFRRRHTIVMKITPDQMSFFNLDSRIFPASVSSKYYQLISAI